MDRFDDIWKNRFNEEDFPIGDWNSPDDDVWKGIIAESIPQKKKRRLWWFWLSLGLVLVLVIGAYLFDGKEKNNSENLFSEEDQFGTLISKSKNLPTEKEKNLIQKEESNFNLMEKTKSPSKKVTEKKNNKVFTKKNITSNISKKEVVPKNSLSEFSNQKVVNQNDGMKKLREKISVNEISFATILLELEQSIHPVTIFSKAIIDDSVPSKLERINFGIQTGGVFWKHRISDQYTSDLSPFDFNYQNAWGWQIGLTMNFELGKFVDAFVGVQYEQVQTTSGHNSNLIYSLDNEENPSDPLNQYALSLATPYGLSGATFDFNRNQTLGANEVDLLVDFHSSHLIKNYSIPVGAVLFPFGKKRKIVPSATFGLAANYLANISNAIQNIETHHAAIQFEDSGSSNFVAPDLEKWHFDYRVGVGLSYALNSSLKFQLTYDWARGINPIFKLENYKTNIDRHHLSIGLTKSLGLGR